MALCVIDWSALGTWFGALATLAAVIVVLRQVRENQVQIARQLSHSAELQSKSLLERHLLIALETAHREPNAARSFFFDAHRFLSSISADINVRAKEEQMAVISVRLEAAIKSQGPQVRGQAFVFWYPMQLGLGRTNSNLFVIAPGGNTIYAGGTSGGMTFRELLGELYFVAW